MTPLSPRALELLAQLFNISSQMQLPVSVATEVIEIRQWVAQMREAAKE